MKTFIFIPDTNKKAGLGHIFRCFGYSNFVNEKFEIIFLVKKNFDKKYLIKKNFKNIKIRYIFFSNLINTLNFWTHIIQKFVVLNLKNIQSYI